ncbi:MAG: four helix bundle protein [Planctomycetota bacterium]
MATDLVILHRTFDLLTWLLPKTERFPRIYRGTVVARMMSAALDLQEQLRDALTQGGSTRERHLRSADASLDKLRVYLRLAHQWHWLNDGQSST